MWNRTRLRQEADIFVSSQTGVVINEVYNAVFNSWGLTGATEYLTL
jgi:hypothetical protein